MARSLDGGAVIIPVGKDVSAADYDLLGAYRGPRVVLWQSRAAKPLVKDNWCYSGALVAAGGAVTNDGDCTALLFSDHTQAGSIASVLSTYPVPGPAGCTLFAQFDATISLTANTNTRYFFRVIDGSGYLGVNVTWDSAGQRTITIEDAPTGGAAQSTEPSGWLLDALDGTGPSRLTIVPATSTTTQPFQPVFVIDTGRVRIGFIIDGSLTFAHEITLQRNNCALPQTILQSIKQVQLGTMTYPGVGVTGTADGRVTLRAVSVMAEGVALPLLPSYSYALPSGASAVPAAAYGSPATLLNGFYVANSAGNTRYGLKPRAVSVLNTGAVPILCQFWHRPATVNGAAPDVFLSSGGWYRQYTSIVKVPGSMAAGIAVTTDPTTVSALIASFMVPIGACVTHTFTDEAADAAAAQVDTTAYGGAPETYALTGVALSGAVTCSTYSVLNWEEYHY